MFAWDVKMSMTQEHSLVTINILDVQLNCNQTQTIEKICKNLHTLKNMRWWSITLNNKPSTIRILQGPGEHRHFC